MPFRKQNGQTHLLHTKNGENLHIMERLWTTWSSLVDKTVKNLPATHKTWVQSLGQEDPLEKGMATQPSVLAWRIPWQRSLEGYCPWGCKESDTAERLSLSHGPPTCSLKIPQCFLIKDLAMSHLGYYNHLFHGLPWLAFRLSIHLLFLCQALLC